jgi:hypothetical protein
MARTAPRRQSRAASGHMVASDVGTCGTLDIFYSIVHPALWSVTLTCITPIHVFSQIVSLIDFAIFSYGLLTVTH